MFPSSSRVKLNRVALKNVIGLKLVPRRRRVPTSGNMDHYPKQKEETRLVSELQSVKNTACVPNTNEHDQIPFTDKMGPESMSVTAGNVSEARLGESCARTQKARRRKPMEPCKGAHIQEFTAEGPRARGKYDQGEPYTRSRCRSDHLKKLCRLRFGATLQR